MATDLKLPGAPTFQLSAFQAALGDGARPNQFMVNITGPSILAGTFNALTSALMVTAASLPGQSIGTATAMYRGFAVKLAGDRSYGQWSTTIINDDGMMMRNSLEGWMKQIEAYDDKKGLNGLSAYSGSLLVTQLDKNGAPLKAYMLYDAWPTDISDVPLSFDANDQISSFTCTWNYQYFNTVATTGKGLAAQAAGGGLPV